MKIIEDLQDKFTGEFDLDFQQLWHDEGYGKDNDLGVSIQYIRKEAAAKGIKQETVDLVLFEVFSEIANGRKFSTAGCTCGCGIKNSGTDVIHYILRRVFEIEIENKVKGVEIMQKRFNKILNMRIKGKKLGFKRRALFELVRSR